MGIIAAGLAVSAIGAGVSAAGAANQASASKEAAAIAAALGKKNAKKQTESLEGLISQKTESLANITSTLDRNGGGPSLQTQENLDLLRKAQTDYLKLGAGDFSAFEDQLKDVMSSTVANSFGAGSPVGTFTQLSAQNIASLRQQGINTGLQASSFLGAETYNLLGAEFAVLDEGFQRQQDIDNQELAILTGAVQQRAENQGAGAAATGSALASAGSALTTYGTGVNNGTIKGFGGQANPSDYTPASSYDAAGLRTASDRSYLSAPTSGYSAKGGLSSNFSPYVADPSLPPLPGGSVGTQGDFIETSNPYGQHPVDVGPIPSYGTELLPPLSSAEQARNSYFSRDPYSGLLI